MSPAEERRHETENEWPVHLLLVEDEKSPRSEPLTVDDGQPQPLTRAFTTSMDSTIVSGYPTGFPWTTYSSTYTLPMPSSTASYQSPSGTPLYPTAFPPTTLATQSSNSGSTSQSSSSSPGVASSNTAAHSSTENSSHDGMSTGALVAAIVVPVVVALAVLLLAIFCCVRRRNRAQSLSSSSSSTNEKSKAAPSIPPVILSPSNNEAYYTGIDTNTSSRGSRELSTRPSADPPPPYKSSRPPRPLHSSTPQPTLLNTLTLPDRPTTARSTSAASITSTLYSDAASIHSARATRMSIGAADVITSPHPQSQHKRSASGSLISDPFKSGSDISDASGLWAGESNIWEKRRSEGVGRRSSEILSPERVSPLGFGEGEDEEEEESEAEGKGKGRDMR